MASCSQPKQCSVGSHLNEPCFLDKFVSEDYTLHTLDHLDNVCQRTIGYRANMVFIPSICNHHIAAFSSKFHLYKRELRCSDPFNLHKSYVKNIHNAIISSLEMCEKLKAKNPHLHIYPDQRLCINCKFKLTNGDNARKISSASSVSLPDMEDALNTDEDFFSPSKPLSVSLNITSTLGVTPVEIDKKKSKTRRTETVFEAGEKVKRKFINLHKEFIEEPDKNVDFKKYS